MLSFSQRQGLKPVKNVFQLDSMDSDLRNGLWNVLGTCFWSRMRSEWLHENQNLHAVIERLWSLHFKMPLDTLEKYWPISYKSVRDTFFACKWHEVYNFIEFMAHNDFNGTFTLLCNEVLERECSAYRFVGARIAQVTSEVEIAEIEKALQVAPPLKSVAHHFKTALELLSDRTSPDYRNSIKESISAVEAISKLITGDSKATLGKALIAIEKEGKLDLHIKLKESFVSLYGYTSDAHGIRHALKDEGQPTFEDAKYMLVSCSAFVNYLTVKATKAGLKF